MAALPMDIRTEVALPINNQNGGNLDRRNINCIVTGEIFILKEKEKTEREKRNDCTLVAFRIIYCQGENF